MAVWAGYSLHVGGGVLKKKDLFQKTKKAHVCFQASFGWHQLFPRTPQGKLDSDGCRQKDVELASLNFL